MTTRFRISEQGQIAAQVYITRNPNIPEELVATIVPVSRSDEFDKEALAVRFEAPVTATYSDTISLMSIVTDMLNKVGVLPETIGSQVRLFKAPA